MSKIVFVFLMLLFSGCKKVEGPEPLPAIKEIVGRWRLVANEYSQNGKVVREKPASKTYLIFRFDGVMLNGNGALECCNPASLVLNGKPFKIEPLAHILIKRNCATVLCLFCEYLDVVQDGDTMVTTLSCNDNYRQFYVRD